MPLIQRFTAKENGAMVLAGNTLNCRQSTAYPPGNDYTNGAYISTNSGLVAAAGFPTGTTFNPTQSSSTAVINIPAGSTILYAQLFWHIFTFPNAVANPDNAITFITPVTTTTISPNLAIKQTVAPLIWQAQDVSALIQAGGSGIYQVANVPGQTVVDNSTFIGNGWGIIIVYKNSSLPLRYFNVNTGLSAVSQSAPSDFNFSNFQTPAVGPLNAYFLVSEINGDLGDQAQIYIGATQATSSKVGNTSTGTWNGVSPYAQIDNMLPGNILIGDTNDSNIGLLDTRGTFGGRNKNPFNATAPAFARCNQDILGLSIGNKLINNQTTLFTRVTYAGSGSGSVTSQSIQVDINSPAFVTSTKAVDKNYADIGETINYTIRLVNTGSISADNVVFMDTIPSSLSFVPGSVYVNGVNQPSYNPQLPGISLGSLGTNIPLTIDFKAVVTTIGSPNPAVNTSNITYNYLTIGTQRDSGSFVTNAVTTTLNSVSLYSTKQVNKAYANIGDILTYTIPVKNTGNLTAFNIVFKDTIPNGTSLVTGSFTENGVAIAGSPNPPGVTLKNLNAGSVTTVVFKVTVNSIPSPNPIPNSATLTFAYTIDPSTVPNRTGTNNSNTNIVNTQVNNANLVGITKNTDKSFVDCGDIINYTIVIPNSGNVTAQNVIFKDTIPSGTTFVANSVYINGTQQVGANPATGITVPNIGPGATTEVKFQVRVNC